MIVVCQPISSILNLSVCGADVGAGFAKRCGRGFGGLDVSVSSPPGSSGKIGWLVVWKPSHIACFRRSRFGTPAFGQFLYPFSGGSVSCTAGYGWYAKRSITGVVRPLCAYACAKSRTNLTGERDRLLEAEGLSLPFAPSAIPITVMSRLTDFRAS